MISESIRAAIETAFATAWASTTPIKYANAPFTVPADGSAYVALHVLDGEGMIIGNTGATNRVRQVGLVQVDIYTRENQGTRPGRQLADQAGAIFGNKRISGCVFRAVSVNSGAAMQLRGSGDQFGGSSGHWRTVMSCPFHVDTNY